jgi:hypothetical protein
VVVVFLLRSALHYAIVVVPCIVYSTLLLFLFISARFVPSMLPGAGKNNNYWFCVEKWTLYSAQPRAHKQHHPLRNNPSPFF